MQIYGAVLLRGVSYCDDEIATIDPSQRLLYGIDWVYDGDQLFEESNICWVLDNGTDTSFGGRRGLNDFLAMVNAHS